MQEGEQVGFGQIVGKDQDADVDSGGQAHAGHQETGRHAFRQEPQRQDPHRARRGHHAYHSHRLTRAQSLLRQMRHQVQGNSRAGGTGQEQGNQDEPERRRGHHLPQGPLVRFAPRKNRGGIGVRPRPPVHHQTVVLGLTPDQSEAGNDAQDGHYRRQQKPSRAPPPSTDSQLNQRGHDHYSGRAGEKD